MQNGITTLEDVWQFLPVRPYSYLMRLAVLLGIYTQGVKNICPHKTLHTDHYLAALFVIATA